MLFCRKKLTINRLFVPRMIDRQLTLIGLAAFFTASLINSEIKAEELVIPKGKTDSCIADTDYMRRNHMDLLTHDRDKTVHEGDRTITASLKDCVACHTVNGDDGKPVTASDEKHFCRTCHDYAAVTIDCFQCHASRPNTTEVTGSSSIEGHLKKVHSNLSTYKLITKNIEVKQP